MQRGNDRYDVGGYNGGGSSVTIGGGKVNEGGGGVIGSWGDIYGGEIIVNGSGGQLAAADPREVAAVTRAVVPIAAAANSIGGDVDRDGCGGTTALAGVVRTRE